MNYFIDLNTTRIALDREWAFALDPENAGVDERWFKNRLSSTLQLPGSLQEQGFGFDVTSETKWMDLIDVERTDYPDWGRHPMYAKYRETGNVHFPYWLQPQKHYIGAAWFQKEIHVSKDWKNRRVVLFLERAHWETKLWVDDCFVGSNDSLLAPHEYDITDVVQPGRTHRISLRVDNDMIVEIGRNAHSVTDQTQTAWNGVIGDIILRATTKVWIDDLQVFQNIGNRSVRVAVTLGNISGNAGKGTLVLSAAGVSKTAEVEWDQAGGSSELVLELGADTPLWDEFAPNLLTLEAQLTGDDASDVKATVFGLREVGVEGTQITVNGRKSFIRGNLECCVFPLTGYPPTDFRSWRRIMERMKEYGLNLLRFHSWCPPEAAFRAADAAGVYIQAELNEWWHVATPEQEAFFTREYQRMIRSYGNHPSFVFMALGNEGYCEPDVMTRLMRQWKPDTRRLYTGKPNSNDTKADDFDFMVSLDYGDEPVRIQRGWPPVPKGSTIVAEPPNTTATYEPGVAAFNGPHIAHETVQRCSYPDFAQKDKYTGLLAPGYIDIARDQLQERGMLDQADAFVLASGRWQIEQFKEEIEAELRTPGFAGFHLLSLHDFPGQGGALVGVLDAFWDEKPYAEARHFRRFCSPTVPLARMQKRVWEKGADIPVEIQFAHFGADILAQAAVSCRVVDQRGESVWFEEFPAMDIPIGNDRCFKEISIPTDSMHAPAQYRLEVSVRDTEISNDWKFWLYPEEATPFNEDDILIAHSLTEDVLRMLNIGGRVLLLPGREQIAGDMGQCFSSIYWNCPWTNGGESHTMGILCDPDHPVFAEFPTDFHSDWQWWELLAGSSPMILDEWGREAPWPKESRPLVQLIDDWNRNRKLGTLVETKVGVGKLIICSMDIENDLENRIVARQFRKSLLDYMIGDAFEPDHAVSIQEIEALFENDCAYSSGDGDEVGVCM